MYIVHRIMLYVGAWFTVYRVYQLTVSHLTPPLAYAVYPLHPVGLYPQYLHLFTHKGMEL